MTIGYDGKRYFHNKSGLGNYSRDLIRILSTNYPEHQYYLYDERPDSIPSHPSISNIPIKGFLGRQLSLGKQAEGCDIFHGLSGELPLRWGPKSPKKIVTIHDLIFEKLPDYYAFLDRKIYFKKFQHACEKADIVVAISEQTKKDIIEYFGTPEDKIKVIYQGCSHLFKRIYSAAEKAEIKEKYSLPDEFILNVGTLESRKNGLILLQALKATDIPLVFIGRKTDYAKKMEQFVQENKMENRVHFLEGLSNEEVAILYSLAKIFAYPSEYEGFGIPIIEALYSGIPVVTNRAGVFPEAGGPSSAYVDIHNADEVKAKLISLWDNELERERMSREGRNFVQKFDDLTLAKQWMELYQTLI